MYLSSSLSLCLSFSLFFVGQVITVIKCLKSQKSQRLLFEGVLLMYLSLSLSLTLSLSLSLSFFGHVMSSHHSDQMSQRSQVSRIAPLRCSLMEVHR